MGRFVCVAMIALVAGGCGSDVAASSEMITITEVSRGQSGQSQVRRQTMTRADHARMRGASLPARSVAEGVGLLQQATDWVACNGNGYLQLFDDANCNIANESICFEFSIDGDEFLTNHPYMATQFWNGKPVSYRAGQQDSGWLQDSSLSCVGGGGLTVTEADANCYGVGMCVVVIVHL